MIDRSRARAGPATNAAEHGSWGNYPVAGDQRVSFVRSRDETNGLFAGEGYVLPYGLGRSYGDSCLNEGGDTPRHLEPAALHRLR